MDTHATIEVLLETVFSTRSVQNAVIRRKTEARIDSWKRADIQRGLEPGSRERATVRSRYPATTTEDTAGWKRQRDLIKCGNQGWRYN
jgi:hypothetical protein